MGAASLRVVPSECLLTALNCCRSIDFREAWRRGILEVLERPSLLFQRDLAGCSLIGLERPSRRQEL